MKRRYNKFKSYGVDSKWELTLKEGLFKDLKYHPTKLQYTVPSSNHSYEPDWELKLGGKVIYIEAKGRFRDRAEFTKYLHIRESLTNEQELVFLFMKPNNALPGAQRRKDGTRRTHAEWAETNDFRWFDETNITTLIGEVK
jgi:hypothetical protein